MRPSGTHLYKRVCRSVGPLRLCKNHFSAVFGHGEILQWNKWSCWESFSPVCLSICLSIHMIGGAISLTILKLKKWKRALWIYDMLHDQYTLRHSPDASLPGRACYLMSSNSQSVDHGTCCIYSTFTMPQTQTRLSTEMISLLFYKRYKKDESYLGLRNVR